MTTMRGNAITTPLGVGIGLRSRHVEEILARPSSVEWFEFTPENYMNRGGAHQRGLREVAERHPMVAHGIGASLGTRGCPSRAYLASLANVIALTRARWASDHLCYTTAGGLAVNELLPLPFTEESVRVVAENVRRIQDAVGVPWLVENVSYYATIDAGEMDEAAFIAAVLEEADCGLLLDVNNVWVNAHNHGYDAAAFIARLPLHRVVQVHLAGHDRSRQVYVDTHGEAVQDEVWKLFEDTWPLLPPCSVLIEWDNGIPPLARLEEEARRARAICAARPKEKGAGGDGGGRRHGAADRDVRGTASSGLSALQVGFREILRAPPTVTRRDVLARVSDLRAADRDALSRVPSDRLAIYHDLVVGSHRALAVHVFGATFALLDVIARERPHLAEHASSREIVEAFLARDFATTTSVRELADRVAAFVSERYPAAFAQVPLLGELMTFERLRLDVDHAQDGPGTPADPVALRDLAALTVGALFDTRVLVPSHLRVLDVDHDVRAVLAALATAPAAATLASLAVPLRGAFVLTRHPDSLQPVFHAVTRDVAEDLRAFPSATPFTLEDLAAARQPRGSAGETEEQALERILAEAFGWLSGGTLFLA